MGRVYKLLARLIAIPPCKYPTCENERAVVVTYLLRCLVSSRVYCHALPLRARRRRDPPYERTSERAADDEADERAADNAVAAAAAPAAAAAGGGGGLRDE